MSRTRKDHGRERRLKLARRKRHFYQAEPFMESGVVVWKARGRNVERVAE